LLLSLRVVCCVNSESESEQHEVQRAVPSLGEEVNRHRVHDD